MLIVRLLLPVCLLLPARRAFPQFRNDYDKPIQRFLAKYVTSFVFGINQGQIDEDSASKLACIKERLPHSLLYDELYDNGAAIPGSRLIDAGRIAAATSLLPQLRGDDRVRLLLHLANYYIYKPGIAKKDADSASFFAQQAVQQSTAQHNTQLLHASYLTLGKLYSETGDTALCRRYIDTVVAERRKNGALKDLALALFHRSDCSPYFQLSRIADYNEAMSIFHSLKDTIHEILSRNKLFTIYFVKGMLDTVRQELYQTMALEKAMGLRELHYNYTVIAYIDEAMHRYGEGLIANTEAIRIMEATADTAFSDIFYSKMGALMLYYHDPEETLHWYYKALASQQPGSSREWCNTVIGLGFALYTLDRPRDCIALIDSTTRRYPPGNMMQKFRIQYLLGICYLYMQQIGPAQQYLYNAVIDANSLLQLPENYLWIGESYMAYAEVKLIQHDLATAALYLKKASGLSTESKFLNMSSYYQVQYKLDSAKGNMTEAWANYRRMRNIMDSSGSIAKARQLEEFRVKFNIAQNEKDLKLLQSQSSLQQSQLEQEALGRKITLAGAAMLLLLLGLLYSRFRLKHRQQQEISRKNHELQSLLEEKEWLIKEIHHRVKNNLQMVVSLLTAQSAHLDNKEALRAIQESEQRMYAMSLIHQKLYQSEKMELIEMSAYIREITGYLNAHGPSDDRVRFELDLEPVQLDVAQAVPLGLILNEAITNAIKYAFTDNRQGTVKIGLHHLPGQLLELTITDNGKGLLEHIDLSRTKSLGLTLMKGLSQQLRGSLELINETGLRVRLRFPVNFFTDHREKFAILRNKTNLKDNVLT